MRKLKEAKEVQKAFKNNKKLPKKFRVDNELIEIDYSFRTKLEELRGCLKIQINFTIG
jgi:hypothetical protein